MNNPAPFTTNLKVLHDSTEWNTHFAGEITKVQVNGKEIMQTHDIAMKTEKLSRQIRLIAILASMIAVVVLVLVSLIYQYEDDHYTEVSSIVHSRKHIADRLYELTGNIWVIDQWIVDPKWQQGGNRVASPSVQAD